jgi:DNA-binding NtrC family response regulator
MIIYKKEVRRAIIMIMTDTNRGVIAGLTVKKVRPNVNMLKRLAKLMMDEVSEIEETGELQLGDGFKLDNYIEQFEINIIRYALQLSGNNQLTASRLLGIKATTLNAKIKRFKLSTTANGGGEWVDVKRNTPPNSQLLRRRNRNTVF